MNKQQLEQNVGRLGRLRPAARSITGIDLDDDWLMTKVADSTVELTHVPTKSSVSLGLDHVKERMSDTSRLEPSPRYGFLVLNVQVLQHHDGHFLAEPIVPRIGGPAVPTGATGPTFQAPQRRETVEENADRLAREREFIAARRRFLTTDTGVRVATTAVGDLFDRVAALQPAVGYDFVRLESAVQIYKKGYSVRVNWHCLYVNSLDESQMVVSEWDGRPDFGSQRYASRHRPRESRQHTFECDIDRDGSQRWRDPDGRFHTSNAVANQAVNLLIELVRESQGARDDWA